MDLLLQIKNKIGSNSAWKGARGIESILTHIEIAERHHERARIDRDEHLFTDAIYRTNHAFEGILKEAYILLSGSPVDRMTTYEIEEYLVSSNALRPRVVDQLKIYRQNWRNPSTHDYQLFFSEQESFLAIISVSAFVSILLDQMLEREAYLAKSRYLEGAAFLARDKIANFENLIPIDKVWKILASFSEHYISNYKTMSLYSRNETTAQIAAFIEKVAPNFVVKQEEKITNNENSIIFDLIVCDVNTVVAIETRESKIREAPQEIHREGALQQLIAQMRLANISNGVIFFLPGGEDVVPIGTISSGAWPEDLNIREVYGEDKAVVDRWMREDEPVSLVDENK